MKRKRKKGDMTGLNIYANALHMIYKTFNNHRLYGSIGFKLPKIDNEMATFKLLSNFDTWIYKPQQMDWISLNTSNSFTEYEIDVYLDYILKNCIDKELY